LPWAIWAIVQLSDGQLPLLRLRTRLWQSRDELAGGWGSEVADSALFPVALSIALLRGHRVVVGGRKTRHRRSDSILPHPPRSAKNGSSALPVQRSGCLWDTPGKHSRFEQFESGPAVHLALDGL
jgi:hypothetical protein